jgi:hypothetical protein
MLIKVKIRHKLENPDVFLTEIGLYICSILIIKNLNYEKFT